MVGRQTPFLALIVPLVLVAVVDGSRGIRQTWPAALVAGVSFAIAQFVCANYISVELTDIIAALVSTVALVGFLRFWKPSEPLLGEGRRAAAGDRRRRGRRPGTRAQRAPARADRGLHPREARGLRALHHHRRRLRDRQARRPRQGVPVRVLRRHRLRYRRGDAERLRLAGPQRHRCGRRGAVGPDLRLLLLGHAGHRRADLRAADDRRAADQLPRRAARLRRDAQPAQVRDRHRDGRARPRLRDEPHRHDQTLGQWLAGAGGVLAFLSPIIGWLGVAITGSDTSSNALFGALQAEAAKEAGLSEVLLASANSSGACSAR